MAKQSRSVGSLPVFQIRHALLGFVACGAIMLACGTARATTLASADFSEYSDGNLVGQNGWQQYQTQVTSPLQVAGGQVSWVSNGTTVVNNQDAMLAFPSQVTQPEVGTTVLLFDMVVAVNTPSTAGVAPSYFAALNTTTGTATAGNFQNARIVASGTTGGFVFGARVNGQSGYPFGYGSTVLDIGTEYALRAEINMVAGNANDFINLYVGPDFDSLTPYATAGYSGTGTVGDPLFGAMLLSQFASATAAEAGVTISRMSVTVVPEPSAAILAALGSLVAAACRARSRFPGI